MSDVQGFVGDYSGIRRNKNDIPVERYDLWEDVIGVRWAKTLGDASFASSHDFDAL